MSKTEQRKARLMENKDIFVTKKEFKQVFDEFMKPWRSDDNNHVQGHYNYRLRNTIFPDETIPDS